MKWTAQVDFKRLARRNFWRGLIVGIIIGYLLAFSIAYAVEMFSSTEESPKNKGWVDSLECDKHPENVYCSPFSGVKSSVEEHQENKPLLPYLRYK